MTNLFSYPIEMFYLMSAGDVQGILFFATVFVSLVCFWSLAKQFQVASWPSVVGKLHRLEVLNLGSAMGAGGHNGFMIEAEYEYHVQGVLYRGERVSMTFMHAPEFMLRKQESAVQQLPDGKLLVFYNPKKPKKSYLIRPSILSRVLTIMPIVFFVSIYIGAKN